MFLFQAQAYKEEQVKQRALEIPKEISETSSNYWRVKNLAPSKVNEEAVASKVTNLLTDAGLLRSNWKETGMSANELKLFELAFIMWVTRDLGSKGENEGKFTKKFIESARNENKSEEAVKAATESALLKAYDSSTGKSALVDMDRTIGGYAVKEDGGQEGRKLSESKRWWVEKAKEIVGTIIPEQKPAEPEKKQEEPVPSQEKQVEAPKEAKQENKEEQFGSVSDFAKIYRDGTSFGETYYLHRADEGKSGRSPEENRALQQSMDTYFRGITSEGKTFTKSDAIGFITAFDAYFEDRPLREKNIAEFLDDFRKQKEPQLAKSE